MDIKLFFKKYAILLFLIIFGLFTLFITIHYKSQAIEKFKDFEKEYIEILLFNNSLILDKRGGVTVEQIFEECTSLKENFFSILYFDKDLYNTFNQICILLLKEVSLEGEALTETNKEVVELFKGFQDKVAEKKVSLIFGFDGLLYCSTILIFIVAVVLFYDFIKQKNEMQAIKLKTDEQVKMSRNLHDGVAQDLAALKLYLETDDKEKAKFYATQAFKEIRYLIGSLHLDLSNDLEKTIQQILRVFEANYGIQTHFYFASDLIVQFSQDIIIEFIRILQETLSNIARHANATEVTVKFIDVSDKLKFIISDNGVGFKIEEMLNLNPEDKMSHYGLSNIQERVRLLGGTVEFVNEGGMTIAITI